MGGQKKTQGIHHCGVPWVQMTLAGLPPFHHSELSYVHFTYKHLGFLVLLSGKHREKYVSTLFLEAEVLLLEAFEDHLRMKGHPNGPVRASYPLLLSLSIGSSSAMDLTPTQLG